MPSDVQDSKAIGGSIAEKVNGSKEKPLVTAVVTTHNRPEMAKRAIRSVLSQTHSPLEIIVVEDGSNSGIEEWLKKEGIRNVRYVLHEDNKGLAAARNTGLHIARGKYVAYLDDDDEWLPVKLAKQVDLFETKGKSVGVVYCGALRISPERKMGREKRPQLRGDIRTAIRENGLSTIPSSGLFRREALVQVGGYDENLLSHVDFDIWLELAGKEYAAEYVDECLVKVHQHEGDKMTADVESRVQATQAFCDKWQCELQSWFGQRGAQRFCFQFKAKVMGMLGWTCFHKGARMQSTKYFLLALRYNPVKREYYTGLVTIGRSLCGSFVQIRKKSRRGKDV